MTEQQPYTEYNPFRKRLNRLLYCTLFAFGLFLAVWTASELRHLFGYDPHWAGDNFAFNIMFLFPATIVCLLMLFFTGGLTLFYWKQLPNLKTKMLILLLSYSVILFVVCFFFMILRQH